MTAYKKVDPRGRSTGRYAGRAGKLMGPPKEPWTWLPVRLLASPTYQALSINARRVFEFLRVEHMNHGGRENGNLLATYDQLRLPPWNCSRRLIHTAFAELNAAGLVVLSKRGGMIEGCRVPATYRLTMYCTLANEMPATNEWAGRSPDQVCAVREKMRAWKELRMARREEGDSTVVPMKRNFSPFTSVNSTGSPS